MPSGSGRTLLAKVGAFAFAGALALPSSLSGAASTQASTVMVATALDVAVVEGAAGVISGAAIEPLELRPPTGLHAVTLAGEDVLASWYGPGFYGGRTACGQTLTEETRGVAHRLLPCGAQVQLTSPAGETLVVPVIDRGPFVAGRSLDLSYATKVALACSDLCRVRIVVLP